MKNIIMSEKITKPYTTIFPKLEFSIKKLKYYLFKRIQNIIYNLIISTKIKNQNLKPNLRYQVLITTSYVYIIIRLKFKV